MTSLWVFCSFAFWISFSCTVFFFFTNFWHRKSESVELNPCLREWCVCCRWEVNHFFLWDAASLIEVWFPGRLVCNYNKIVSYLIWSNLIYWWFLAKKSRRTLMVANSLAPRVRLAIHHWVFHWSYTGLVEPIITIYLCRESSWTSLAGEWQGCDGKN